MVPMNPPFYQNVQDAIILVTIKFGGSSLKSDEPPFLGYLLSMLANYLSTSFIPCRPRVKLTSNFGVTKSGRDITKKW